MPRSDALGLSVIVCSRNRATQLERCLSRFGDADISSEMFELIVVDNNSSDSTPAVVRAFGSTAPFPVRYLLEERQGLSYARNCGIAAASYSIMAFTDDDCLIDRLWVSTILHEFSTVPSLGALGGRVLPEASESQPVGTRVFSDRLHISHFDELFSRMIGCNMAFSRNVFEIVGLFDPLFGKGTSLGSAEDLDLLYRMLKKRLPIVYSPLPVVFHAHGRETQDSVQQVNDDYARGRGGFYWKHVMAGDLRMAKRALREILDVSRLCLIKERRPGAASPPLRVLRNLATGAFYRLIGGGRTHGQPDKNPVFGILRR